MSPSGQRGLALLDHAIISERYFFPLKVASPDPFWVPVDGARLACWRRIDDPTRPTVVFFHGNGEVVADYLPWFADVVNSLGANLVLAEYRGYSESTGAPRLGRMLTDVRRIVDAIGVPSDRLVAFGRSVGSLFALHLVSEFPDAAGLILESGIADVAERLLLRMRPHELGVSDDVMHQAIDDHLNHQKKLANYTGRSLILHTRHDGLVDLAHARKLLSWANEPKRGIVFERGDHNSVFAYNRDAYIDALATFLSS